MEETPDGSELPNKVANAAGVEARARPTATELTYQDFVKVARLQAQRTGAGLPGREPTANRALRY